MEFRLTRNFVKGQVLMNFRSTDVNNYNFIGKRLKQNANSTADDSVPRKFVFKYIILKLKEDKNVGLMVENTLYLFIHYKMTLKCSKLYYYCINFLQVN